MKRPNLTIIFVFILLCSVWHSKTPFLASDNSVRVYGTVTDESGEAVPGALVTFRAAGDSTSSLTDSSGMYSVELTPPSTHVEESTIPKHFVLHQNYPNPFNPTTVIEYELNQPAHVKLDIYNMAGQVVRTLRDGFENTGIHSVRWDGCDDDGRGVAAGVYLYRLQAGNVIQTKKMVLVDGGLAGQVVSGSYDVLNQLSKAARITGAYYNIVVEKEGFETYREEEFEVSDDLSEVRKDFLLNTIIDSGTYTLEAKPTRVRSYIGGGGLFLIILSPGEDFNGKVYLSLDVDPALHAELTTESLSNNTKVAELTIMPDSTVTFGSFDPEAISEFGLYLIKVINKHIERTDTLFLETRVIKNTRQSYEYLKESPSPESFINWVESEHPMFGITKGGEWFAYRKYPYLGDMYRGSDIVTEYLNSMWNITHVGSGPVNPPAPHWYLLRKRGEASPLLAAKKIVNTPYQEVAISEFPFSIAFYWEYFGYSNTKK